ncbi:MAG TPA: TatD family hydrolase [Myxococcaceae bacterium]|nr:TatD family hydrolase [Myxococcaceae bacterium]
MEAPEPLFDAHLHPEGLTDQDLDTLRHFGVQAAVAIAHHSPKEATAKALLEHFDALLGKHLPRLERAGIRGYAALGVHPQRLPRRGLGEVMTALPGYFRGGKVVAIGEVGLHRGDEAEQAAFAEHLALARRLQLRVVVHTPIRDKESLTRRTLTLLKASGVEPGNVLVDHVDGRTLRGVSARRHWVGLTVHPEELSAERVVSLVSKLGAEHLVLDSDSGDGPSDILGLARCASLLARAKLSARFVRRLACQNAAEFFRVEL